MDSDSSIPPNPYASHESQSSQLTQDGQAGASFSHQIPSVAQHFHHPTQQPTTPVNHQQLAGSLGNPATPQTQAQVDEVLRKKRKAREYKACYPCRQRKVKCNNTVPCETCVQRDHPHLCTYHPPDENHPPAKRPNLSSFDTGLDGLSSAQSGANGGTFMQNNDGSITVSREMWDRVCSQAIDIERATSDLKTSLRNSGPPDVLNGTSTSIHTSGYHNSDNYFSRDGESSARTPTDNLVRHVTSQGIHTRSGVNGEMVHLGGSSVPGLIVNLSNGDSSHPGLQELLGKSMLPLFALDNESATYPFVDLWGLPHGSEARARQLAQAVPQHEQCMNYFQAYKEIGYPIFPVLPNIDAFHSDLMIFLINQAKYGPENWGPGKADSQQMTIYGQSIRWTGLLFAILASGSQCALNVPRKERELTANVYVCCSFECLRFTNYLSNATLETVQTLLIIGNVISNHMNAGVSWTLLGTTIRIAQALGLHRSCPPSTPTDVKKTRKRIWWAVLWQDSLLSITYDRAPGTFSGINEQPPYSDGPGNRRYLDCMLGLSKVMIDIVRDRDAARENPPTIPHLVSMVNEHRRTLQDIMKNAADFLKDSRRCRDRKDQLEHWVFYLHMSYTTSELCRAAISPSQQSLNTGNEEDAEDLRQIRKVCIDNLANTVQAFLGMQNVTPFATRSWAAVHRSLSSALLLGILGEHTRNKDTRMLLGQLVSVLQDVSRTVSTNELNGPIMRSITALRKILGQEPTSGPPTSTGTDHNGNGNGLWGSNDAGLDLDGATTTAVNVVPMTSAWDVDPAIMGYSPDVSLHSDNSPHAMMDSILWGGKTEFGNVI